MNYDVQFSLEAAAELVRIAGEIGSAASALQAADRIRRNLENDPAKLGKFLSEGLYFIDDDPLRAFFLIDVESMVVEVTDFRILLSANDSRNRATAQHFPFVNAPPVAPVHSLVLWCSRLFTQSVLGIR